MELGNVLYLHNDRNVRVCARVCVSVCVREKGISSLDTAVSQPGEPYGCFCDTTVSSEYKLVIFLIFSSLNF